MSFKIKKLKPPKHKIQKEDVQWTFENDLELIHGIEDGLTFEQILLSGKFPAVITTEILAERWTFLFLAQRATADAGFRRLPQLHGRFAWLEREIEAFCILLESFNWENCIDDVRYMRASYPHIWAPVRKVHSLIEYLKVIKGRIDARDPMTSELLMRIRSTQLQPLDIDTRYYPIYPNAESPFSTAPYLELTPYFADPPSCETQALPQRYLQGSTTLNRSSERGEKQEEVEVMAQGAVLSRPQFRPRSHACVLIHVTGRPSMRSLGPRAIAVGPAARKYGTVHSRKLFLKIRRPFAPTADPVIPTPQPSLLDPLALPPDFSHNSSTNLANLLPCTSAVETGAATVPRSLSFLHPFSDPHPCTHPSPSVLPSQPSSSQPPAPPSAPHDNSTVFSPSLPMPIDCVFGLLRKEVQLVVQRIINLEAICDAGPVPDHPSYKGPVSATLTGMWAKWYFTTHETVVGRSESAQVDLREEGPCPRVSRKHLVFTVDEDSGIFVVRNCGRTPILLDAELVFPNSSAIVPPTCIITIGKIALLFSNRMIHWGREQVGQREN